MRWSAYILLLAGILSMLFFVKSIYAYPLDCADGVYKTGDCNGVVYQEPVDCAPYTNGVECCKNIAKDPYYQQSTPGLQATCSNFCAFGPWSDPNHSTCSYDTSGSQPSCTNSSCQGAPVFCCNYSTPAPTPTPTPTPTPFSCTDQSGLSFACFTSSCPANWVSAVQNPNTTCASSGQTCCWYNPPAPSIPDCDSGIVCGSCNLATSGNYCSNNGIRSCTYTTYTGGGTCDPVTAPSQTCNINNCSPGYTCQNGSCTLPTQTCTPDGTCNAPAPACGTTTSGTDNCGNSCTKQSPACAPTP